MRLLFIREDICQMTNRCVTNNINLFDFIEFGPLEIDRSHESRTIMENLIQVHGEKNNKINPESS